MFVKKERLGAVLGPTRRSGLDFYVKFYTPALLEQVGELIGWRSLVLDGDLEPKNTHQITKQLR